MSKLSDLLREEHMKFMESSKKTEHGLQDLLEEIHNILLRRPSAFAVLHTRTRVSRCLIELYKCRVAAPRLLARLTRAERTENTSKIFRMAARHQAARIMARELRRALAFYEDAIEFFVNAMVLEEEKKAGFARSI